MPTEVDLLIHSADQLLTLAGLPQRGRALGELGIIPNGALAAAGIKIVAVGPSAELRQRYSGAETIDAAGQVLLPGLIDPHTHLVWAGDRAAEFELRLKGASYMEIMAAGGGIASTVASVRSAPIDQLLGESRARTSRMLANGTTTAEAKTGYGLNIESEIKLLQAILQLDEEGPLELVPTFLGAHALPPEYADRPDGYQLYTDFVAEEMLPAVWNWWQEHSADRPLPFVDVFCEQGAFSLEQSRTILSAAVKLGFPIKIHADEFAGLGGTGLAVELGAASADHLVYTPQNDIAALGASDTVAVALPCTPFGLGHPEYTPAEAILNAGGILAIASDLNPGTAWCESMQFAIALACRAMRITPAQAIAAATINAAAAIGQSDRLGSLEAGKQADLLLLEAPDYRHLGYRFGTNLVSMVVKRGQVVVDRRGMETI